MSLTAFYPFPRLPAELRWQIYLLATQPRFVQLKVESLVELTQEEEEEGLTDFEVFAARLAPWNLTLDSSLCYFAHDWRYNIHIHERISRSAWRFQPRNPDRATQTLLTSYGFSTTKRRHQPWPPTPQHPEIPTHLLYTQPKAAWQMTRPHALYSAAPIPPLLHTCAESREVLIRHGYELAFRTRSTEPRTWFCFRDDVLYLPRLTHAWNDPETRYDEDDENPGVWDLHPDDLVRVRRLALDTVFVWDYHHRNTSQTLRVCPNVRELFGVQQRVTRENRAWLLHCRCYNNTAAPEEAESSEDDKLWEWIECDEADAVSHVAWGRKMNCGIGLDCAGPEGEYLIRWKRSHSGSSAGYFEAYAGCFEDALRERLKEVVLAEKDQVKPWNIPSVKLGIVGTRRSIKAICKAREKYWLTLREEERLEQERGISPSNWVED
jgi:hypothetical protein